MNALVVVVGETASGKSALAMKLAEMFSGEIICADSWSVYEHFDIGTAKPKPQDEARVRHHLIDVADPREGYSAALFKVAAEQAISDIRSRSKLPILVGGTGLYVDSVLYNYGFLERADATERRRLNALDLSSLLAYSTELGLDMSGIDIRNKRRVIRHIENRGIRPERHTLRNDAVIVGLRIPQEQLLKRIEARVEDMLSAGLESEVRNLAEQYGWDVEPMKGIGYREWQAYFAARQTYEQTKEQIVRDSVQLAKKQRTWFKRNNSIQWVSDPSEAVDIVTTYLNK